MELSIYPIEGVALAGALAVLQGPPELGWPTPQQSTLPPGAALAKSNRQ